MIALFSFLKQEKYYKILILLARLGLGLLFIYASLDKIWNPALFAKAISNYRLLPPELLQLSAIILPWLELVIGMALVFNYLPRAANVMLGGLTIVFTLAIISAMARGLDFNCGCFSLGSDDVNIGSYKIFQNVLIILSSALLERFYRSQ